MKPNKITQPNITTIKEFTVLARPDIAQKGMQPGTITDVYQETGEENGKEMLRMVIVFQLDAKDRSGKPFSLHKTYNLGQQGRGPALFLNDYYAMTGKELKMTDLYEFNPANLLNLRVQVDVDYSANSKTVASTIKGFQPLPTEQPAVAAAA